MRKFKLIIVPIFISIFFISCNKNDSNPISTNQNNESVLDYYPLKVGTQWIYELYESDTSLNFSSSNKYDTSYIKKDTTINGSTYFKMVSTMFNKTVFLRDSSDYIVNSRGMKLFTINKNDEILYEKYYLENDSSYIFEWGVEKIDSNCTIPLGEYSAKFIKGLVKNYNSTDDYKERKLFTAYTKDIGPILIRQSYLMSEKYLERRLIEYRIN